MVIYKITNLKNNKIYIGQTIRDIKQRFIEHCKPSSECSALKFAIKKYGKQNFIIEELYYSFNLMDLNEKEEYFINIFNSCNKKFGYNCNFGGNNRKHSKETKIKISKAHIGKKREPFSKSWRQKISEANKNRKGEIRSKLARLNYSISKGAKPFNVFLNNKFIGTWVNQSECSETLGLNNKKISLCLNKKNKQHKGYTFNYIGE